MDREMYILNCLSSEQVFLKMSLYRPVVRPDLKSSQNIRHKLAFGGLL